MLGQEPIGDSSQGRRLPVIDISPFLAPPCSPEALGARSTCAAHIDHACREFGFFYISNHGIPSNLSSGIIQLARDFFSLPDQEKDELSISKNDHARGYQRLGQNVTQYAKDWHEGLDLYAPVGPDHPIRRRGINTLSGSNPSPASLPHFSDTVDRYVAAMKVLGQAVMHAIAVGLSLDETTFDSMIDNPFWVMRMIGYPPLNIGNKSDDIGVSCGEHTDYGCLTILNADDTQGALQVRDKSGQWIHADPLPGAFVVNIGDMLEIWTHGIYKSTPHRVVHTRGGYRVSVPFFYEPNFEAYVQPLDGCAKVIHGDAKGCDECEGKKYSGVLYGDHLLGKVCNNFDN